MRHICGKFTIALSLICVALPAMAPDSNAQSKKHTDAKHATPAPKTVETKKAAPQAAPAKLASRPPAALEDFSKSNRVAILAIDGPKVFDIDADEIWKIKNGSSSPKQGDLVQLSRMLKDSIAQQLRGRLGATLVPEGEVARVATSVAPSVGSLQYQQQVAKELRARYIVDGAIDRVEFDGNTVLPDVYAITASMRVIDATTGQAVWSENMKKFHSKIYTKKSAKTVMQNFSEDQLPDVATYFASRVAQVLGR